MGSSKRQRKLHAAEDRVGPISGEDEAERQRRRQALVNSATHANRCGAGREFGHTPLFRVDQGRVFSTVDGKELTDRTQTLSEQFYWTEVLAFGIGPGHVHHKDEQEIRTSCGRLILSRERVSLPLLTGMPCQCLDCQKAREEWRGVGGSRL